MDEVQTGLGRTGDYMWGFMNYEVCFFCIASRDLTHTINKYIWSKLVTVEGGKGTMGCLLHQSKVFNNVFLFLGLSLGT